MPAGIGRLGYSFDPQRFLTVRTRTNRIRIIAAMAKSSLPLSMFTFYAGKTSRSRKTGETWGTRGLSSAVIESENLHAVSAKTGETWGTSGSSSAVIQSEHPHPLSAKTAETRVGRPVRLIGYFCAFTFTAVVACAVGVVLRAGRACLGRCCIALARRMALGWWDHAIPFSAGAPYSSGWR